MGGFLRNAGLNEVMALFILLVSFKMYNQQEVTQTEIEAKIKRKVKDAL